MPPLGGPCRNIAIRFGTEKLEWCGYQMVERLMTCLAVSTQYWHTTDYKLYNCVNVPAYVTVIQSSASVSCCKHRVCFN